jgi:hypothetical protein
MAAASLTTILDNLNDYADYEEVGSVARAKSFITAAKRFLQLPSTQTDQGSSESYTPEMVRKELEFARQYVRANQSATATTSSVRFLGVGSDFR